MTQPTRVLLSRKKGYRLPDGAKVVARPSQWGNPFRVGDSVSVGLIDATDDTTPVVIEDRATAVRFYRIWIARRLDMQASVRRNLAGRDLACWCPLDQPCHADVLLRIANSEEADHA